MSNENAKKFFYEIEKNPDLKKKFEEVMKDCHESTLKMFSLKMNEVAQEAGFKCSVNDFNDMMNESSELSDDDMMKASGGYWRVYPPYWYYQEKYGKKK